MISTGKRSIKLVGVSEVLIDTTLIIGNPCIMEGFGRIFVVDGVYKLATSQGDKVIKEEDFELGK